MSFRNIICVAAAAFCLSAVSGTPARAQAPRKEAPPGTGSNPQEARKAIERSLSFLQKDAGKWKSEHKCATCHHGILTIWALSEARSQGYEVSDETLENTLKWTKGQFLPRLDKSPKDNLGKNYVSFPAISLAVMAQTLPERKILSSDESQRISTHILRFQEADGAWKRPFPSNGPYTGSKSSEKHTVWASLALVSCVSANPKGAELVKESREKAVAWMNKTKSDESVFVPAVRLLLEIQTGLSPEEIKRKTDELLSRQNSDGGWGQFEDLASDAYATGQVLYVLGRAGVKNDRMEIRRGVSFLVGNQKEDGSWPMIPRGEPGEEAAKTAVPITYFGSAWGALGLMRSVPRNPLPSGDATP